MMRMLVCFVALVMVGFVMGIILTLILYISLSKYIILLFQCIIN